MFKNKGDFYDQFVQDSCFSSQPLNPEVSVPNLSNNEWLSFNTDLECHDLKDLFNPENLLEFDLRATEFDCFNNELNSTNLNFLSDLGSTDFSPTNSTDLGSTALSPALSPSNSNGSTDQFNSTTLSAVDSGTSAANDCNRFFSYSNQLADTTADIFGTKECNPDSGWLDELVESEAQTCFLPSQFNVNDDVKCNEPCDGFVHQDQPIPELSAKDVIINDGGTSQAKEISSSIWEEDCELALALFKPDGLRSHLQDLGELDTPKRLDSIDVIRPRKLIANHTVIRLDNRQTIQPNKKPVSLLRKITEHSVPQKILPNLSVNEPTSRTNLVEERQVFDVDDVLSPSPTNEAGNIKEGIVLSGEHFTTAEDQRLIIALENGLSYDEMVPFFHKVRSSDQLIARASVLTKSKLNKTWMPISENRSRHCSRIITLIKMLHRESLSNSQTLKATAELNELLNSEDKTWRSCGRPHRGAVAMEEHFKAAIRTLLTLNRRRIRSTSLPGDGREHGLVLGAIYRLLRCSFKEDKIPAKLILNDPQQLNQAGVKIPDQIPFICLLKIIKDVQGPDAGAPLTDPSVCFLPPTLMTLAGLRGIHLFHTTPRLSLDAHNAEESKEDAEAVPALGDPEADDLLLSRMISLFYWSNLISCKAVVDLFPFSVQEEVQCLTKPEAAVPVAKKRGRKPNQPKDKDVHPTDEPAVIQLQVVDSSTELKKVGPPSAKKMQLNKSGLGLDSGRYNTRSRRSETGAS